MGIFNNKTEEEKFQELIDKFGLDISGDITDIKKQNSKNLNQILRDISGNSWFKAGMALSFASADKQATVGYLSAIFNQNWILIRQNEIIIRLLDKLASKNDRSK